MKFKEFIKKIKFKKDNLPESPLQEKFIKDLEENEVIYIDNKPYLKVKIKFVETNDYSTSKQIDHLEEITTEQEKQIKQLNELITSKDSIIASLENLARNTKHELEVKTQHQKEHILKIQETISEANKKITDLNKDIQNKCNEIAKLNKDNLNLRGQISLLMTVRKRR